MIENGKENIWWIMVEPFIKVFLGLDPDTDDKIVSREWNKRTKNVCKPCWELKYCPYGPLVEEFPLLPPIRKDAIEHNNFLKQQLQKGFFEGKEQKPKIIKEIEEFNPSDYPVKHDKKMLEKSCDIFGHLCPVFFVNEPFTETSELRRIGPYIPRHIMLQVARRDNNQCQICGKMLRDIDIEFDHIIPRSKGGSSEANNLRVTCFDCNRDKLDKVEI